VRGGDRVRVLVPGGRDIPARREEDGVEIEAFRYAPRALEVIGYGRSLAADEHLRGASALAAPLYLLGARRAVARALRAERWDVVQGHWIVPNGLVVAPFARRARVGFGLHGSDVFLAEKPVARTWVRRALRQGSFLTSCSPELARRITALGFPEARTTVIPYGVDVEVFRPDAGRRARWRGRLGIPDGAPLALGVGRMATKKGFQVLIEAWPETARRLPDLHLALAGGGDRLEEFRHRTEPWRDRVHLVGPVMHDELPDLYRASDLFVLPAVHDSKGNVDGLPNVILEAMASGLPVIATGISGIPLAVVDGETGRLVGEGDARSLADALVEVASSPWLRRSWGEAARRRAEDSLTWDAVASRYRAAYVAALNRD